MHNPMVCELNPPKRRTREEMEEPAYGSSSFGEHRNVRRACPPAWNLD